MTFLHPWVLVLLAALAAWAAWEWRRSYRRLGLLFKAAVFALVLLAIAQPRLEFFESDLAVAILTDQSSSIPNEQLEQQRNWVRQLEASAGDNLLRPLVFDDRARRGLPGQGEAVARLNGTDLEAAIRNALAVLPSDRVSRIVLASDGQENRGSVERAVFQARERGVPIDVIPLAGRAAPELRLGRVTIPPQVFVGEQFPIELAVTSPVAAAATVELRADGRPLGTSAARLRQGENLLRVRARVETPGSALISGMILTGELGDLPFSGVVTLTTPRALLISPPGFGDEGHFRQVLEAAGYKLSLLGAMPSNRSPAPAASSLRQSFELIVANNQDFEAWPRARKQEIEEFVSAGGGFLLIAGENNLYVEREEDDSDPLNRMLPATLAPPRTPEGTAVVLVLDKSSSMEGKKMQLARQSAMGVVDNLRAVDLVGVLAFDNSHNWAVPLRKNENPEQIKQLIGSIIADGGTQIAPALHEAFRQILPQNAVYKHILLLTDGISEEGDSIQLAREAAGEEVTISTIGLGQDVNRAYLERVATTAQGRAYFLIDIAQLAQVVLRDVLEHTGSSVTEREFRPQVLSQAEIFDDIDIGRAGPLLGWVRFEAKPAAETLLGVDDKDPLLARWQYGLGRSAVFASDAKNRWAANWVAWPGFDRFWSNLVRDLLPRTPEIEARAEFDAASGEVVVSYRGESAAPGRLLVIGPEGFRAAVDLERKTAGAYQSRFDIGGRFGLFRIRPAQPDSRLPETAYYRENDELTRFGSNPALLEAIAQTTSGRYNPRVEEIFDARGRRVRSQIELWPGLLALAVLLNLIEIFARKGWLPWLGRWA